MILPFAGFPSRPEVTPVPNIFFGQVVPEITDLSELKVTLHLIWILTRKAGHPRFVTLNELAADTILMTGMANLPDNPTELLRRGLDLAIKRCTILSLDLEKDGQRAPAYFLNTPADKRAVDDIRLGKIELRGVKLLPESLPVSQPPHIFSLYEQNIGMLTPMIAEELREAESLYPPEWLQDAVKEAVNMNKRNWKYVARILERWAVEGRSGKPGRYPKRETNTPGQLGGYQRHVKH